MVSKKVRKLMNMPLKEEADFYINASKDDLVMLLIEATHSIKKLERNESRDNS